MSDRIQLASMLPHLYKKLIALNNEAHEAAVDAGLEPAVLELVKIRASQINGCAFCLDMHTADARKQGEDERRLALLPAWRETSLYTEPERAALDLTEAITRLCEHADVPDDVYQRATKTLTEQQFGAVVWAATVINAFNRLAVTSHKPLP